MGGKGHIAFPGLHLFRLALSDLEKVAVTFLPIMKAREAKGGPCDLPFTSRTLGLDISEGNPRTGRLLEGERPCTAPQSTLLCARGLSFLQMSEVEKVTAQWSVCLM